MRTSLFSLLASTLLAAPAFASDLPLPPEALPVLPAAEPIWSWSGGYVGLNAGYGWGEFESEIDVGNFNEKQGALKGIYGNDPLPFDFEPEGFLGGGQIGINHQFGNHFVIGLEADAQGTAIDEDFEWPRFDGPLGDFADEDHFITGQYELEWFGTLRARGGLAFNRFLLYVTGGLAFGESKLTITDVDTEEDPEDQVHRGTQDLDTWGWTVGGGVEAMLAEHVTAKAEYLFLDLGENDFELPLTGGAQEDREAWGDTEFNFQLFRLGLNYKFW